MKGEKKMGLEVFDIVIQKKRSPKDKQMVVTSMNVSKTQLDQLNLVCKSNGISRCEFIRGCIELGLNKIRTSTDKGYIYVIQNDFLKGIKIGKTGNLEETTQLYFADRQYPDSKRLHYFHTNNMHVTEQLLFEHFKDKRIKNSELFLLDDEDIQWFNQKGYLSIKEIYEYVQD